MLISIMDIESLRQLCRSLAAVTEDIKWSTDLCFCVGEKMFCVTGLQPDAGISFKVTEEEFYELTSRDGIIPAPYMARNMWVYVTNKASLTKQEWEHYIRQSYDLVGSKLSKKLRKELGI